MPRTTKSVRRRAPNRSDPRRARTRAALIRAAQELIADGHWDASVQQITQTAGVGFGSFFNHFTTKAELWTAAIAATLGSYAEQVQSLTADIDDPAEVFCIGLRLTGRLQRTQRHLARVLLQIGLGAIVAEQGGLLAHARHDLDRTIESGRFDIADADLALHMTTGSMLGLTALLDADPDADADALADEHAARLLRAFGLGAAATAKLLARPLPG